MSKGSQMKRVLVIPDLHVPQHDRKALGLVEAYAKSEGPWDQIVQLGDWNDFPQLASQTLGNLKAQGKNTIRDDYDEGERILDRWQKLAKRIDILQGNHDERIERWLGCQPLFTGSLEVQNGLHLKERGIGWHPVWENASKYALRIGKADFIHGMSVSPNHARITGARWGDNVIYGHTHDAQCATFERRGKVTHVAQSLGWLGGEKAIAYQRGRPNKHEHAFGVFHFFPDGFFQYFVVRIFRGRLVAPGGKVFK